MPMRERAEVQALPRQERGGLKVPPPASLGRHRLGDLGALHDAWSGWTLHARTGELVSPNGYRFEPGKLAMWPLLCEQARFWRQDFARRTAGGVGGEAPARRSRRALDLDLAGGRDLGGPAPCPGAGGVDAPPGGRS